MLRAVILAATITALILHYLNLPEPVVSPKVDYCVQPIWDQWGREIGGKWVLCSALDRYEVA